MIRIKSIAVNNLENSTTVTLDILEQVGSLQRVRDSYILTLAERFESINEALMSAVAAKLDESGVVLFPLEE